MIIRVDRLIYIYMALCASLLVFNLLYTGRRRLLEIRSPRRIRWWRDYLGKMAEEEGPLQPEEEKKLLRRLGRILGLLNFQETVERLREEGGSSAVDAWMRKNRQVFVGIGSRYLKRKAMEQAYYAYVVWQNGLCGSTGEDAVIRYMFCLVGEQSIYCRENALQAIYSGKNPELVIKAYKILERFQIKHSQKLVTDGLASFGGDRKELAECFWAEWDSFSPYYQTAFINFMRLSADGFGERLLELLGGDADREVQFAVLRYLRRYHCGRAAGVLQKMVREWDVDDWEFPALAAAALENYPSKKTIKALYEGMHSTSWYVRNNASDSLLKIVQEEKLTDRMMREGDKYAREMLRYKLDRQKEESRDDGCG